LIDNKYMRLTNIICFSNKKSIPTERQTKFKYCHQDRETMCKIRKNQRVVRGAYGLESSSAGQDSLPCFLEEAMAESNMELRA